MAFAAQISHFPLRFYPILQVQVKYLYRTSRLIVSHSDDGWSCGWGKIVGIIIKRNPVLLARTSSIVNKVLTVLNREYCKPHNRRHVPSRHVRKTGGARAPTQDHLAPIPAHESLHWMLWGGWIDNFTMYIHVFDKIKLFFLLGSLAKLICFLCHLRVSEACKNTRNSDDWDSESPERG